MTSTAGYEVDRVSRGRVRLLLVILIDQYELPNGFQ